MRKSFLFGLILFFTLAVEAFCLSRDNRHVETSLFSVHDGLTGARITAIFQDSKGYLWIGTGRGLNRYDGYGFRQYLHRYGDTSTIAGDYILDITEDNRGNIWVATGKGVSRKDAGRDVFVSFYLKQGGEKKTDPGISHLMAGGEGSIWGVDSSGIQMFDKAEGCFVKVAGTPDKQGAETRNPAEGRFLYGKGILYVWDRRGKKIPARYEIPGAGKVFFVVPFFDTGKLLIGRGGRMMLFDPLGGEALPLTITGEKNTPVTACYGEKERIWLAAGRDIYAWKKGVAVPEKFCTVTETGDAEITALWHDRTGVLWAGTTGGLIRIYAKQPEFRIWPVNTGAGPAAVSAVLVYANRLWAGTAGQGIFLLDKDNGRTIRHFLPATEIPGKVYALYRDKRGLIWAGMEKGLKIYDRGQERFVPAGDYLGVNLPDTLPVFTIDTTFDGDLWMGSAGMVFRLAGNMSYLKKYVLPERSSQQGNAPGIHTLFQAPDTRIWVGGDHLLGRIEPAFGEIIVLNDFPGEDINMLRITGSSPDTLWAVTDKGPGIITVNPAGFSPVDDKMINVSFYTGIMDHRGTFWLGSERGLVRYNTGFGDLVTVNTGGEGQSRFTGGGSLSARGGVFLGGEGFVLGFHPDTLRKHSVFPAVVIETLRYLAGKDWYETTAREEITIKSDNLNLIEMGFKALDFRDPGRNRIMYRIDGDDNQWHIIPGSEKVYLTDLKNRTYRVYVRSSGANGEWSATHLLMTFHTRNLFRFIYLVFIVIFLIIIGLIVAYIDYRTRSLVETNKLLKEKEKIAQKLQEQRDRLSFMHKNLTDSIRYAQKIQQALLPSEYYFHRLLPESFILFLPRDIVSGDFYWIHEKGDKIFFTVADCTGHGVPGAFMSMIGFEILDKIINDQGIVHPDEILNILNYGIVNTFSRGEEDMLLKDGMDISFCMLDRDNMILEFAGAFHTLYLIRDNTLQEYRGDRMSVGFGEIKDEERYTRHEIPLEKGDRIYLFTDGYPDQFGGPGGKKFMFRRFRHLLLSIHQLPMWQQQYILHERFQDWKGDRFQVDDVLVIGMDPWSVASGPVKNPGNNHAAGKEGKGV